LCVITFSYVNRLYSAIIDNRWIPLIWRPFITDEDRPSHVRCEFFAVTGKRAYDEHKDEMLLPAIYGKYDQGDLARAMVALGYPNPLKPEWQGASIPWRIAGKLQGQGFTFAYQQAITDWLSFGLYSYVLHLESWHEFFLEMDKISIRLQPGDLLELDEVRRSMHSQIGLCGDHAHHTGIGDVDFYVRVGHIWDYVLKFKSIDAGLRIGALCPAAPMRDEQYPASIPFGGERQWGIYGAVDVEFELKEDWKAGLFGWVGKRFASCQNRRVPIHCEPQPYGASCQNVWINPGITFALSPYFALENLRDGFGLRGQYTLRFHDHDCWKTSAGLKAPGLQSQEDQTLKKVNELSAWGSDYFSVSAFYDFSKVNPEYTHYPIITLTWDIPAAVFVADRSAKTQQISLGIEWNY